MPHKDQQVELSSWPPSQSECIPLVMEENDHENDHKLCRKQPIAVAHPFHHGRKVDSYLEIGRLDMNKEVTVDASPDSVTRCVFCCACFCALNGLFLVLLVTLAVYISGQERVASFLHAVQSTHPLPRAGPLLADNRGSTVSQSLVQQLDFRTPVEFVSPPPSGQDLSHLNDPIVNISCQDQIVNLPLAAEDAPEIDTVQRGRVSRRHRPTRFPTIPNTPVQLNCDKEAYSGGNGVPDSLQDNRLASLYSPCKSFLEIEKEAEQSGKPYMVIQGMPVGYTPQMESLMRAVWLAKVTRSVLVLPPFYLTYAHAPDSPQPTRMAKYFDVPHFISQVYCTQGIYVVKKLSSIVRSRLSLNSSDWTELLKEENPLVEVLPDGLLHVSDPSDSVAVDWHAVSSPKIDQGKLLVLVYRTRLSLAFESPLQKQVKKDSLAAFHPSRDIHQVVRHLQHQLADMHRDRFPLKAYVSFAALHLFMDAGLPSSALENITDVLQKVVPPTMLLYVATGQFDERDSVLDELRKLYTIVVKDDLDSSLLKRFPEREILAAFEMWMAKDAHLFLGPSISSFSGFLYQMRCFTPSSGGLYIRKSIFFDQGPNIVPCHIRKSG